MVQAGGKMMARRRDRRWPGVGTGAGDYTLKASGIGEPRKKKRNNPSEKARENAVAPKSRSSGTGSVREAQLDAALRLLVGRYGRGLVEQRLRALRGVRKQRRVESRDRPT